jgi:phage baseplate assembly protein W
MDWAGTDFYLNKDLAASSQGDYALVTDKQNVDISLKRRLRTPQGSLFYDKTYGNPVFSLLSNIADNNFVEKAKKAISDCLAQEARITVQNIDFTTIPKERRVIFYISYTYANNSSTVTTIQGGISSGGVTVQN